MTMYGPAPVRLSKFPFNYEKCMRAHFLSMETSERAFAVKRSSFWNFLPIVLWSVQRRELGRECSEEKGMSGKPCMASEMLSPGNVDIAIKGTVWISQGVPCPVSIVTCYPEQLGRVRQGAACVRRPPEWGSQVEGGKHGVFGVSASCRTL